jgi:uncharacterized protein
MKNPLSEFSIPLLGLKKESYTFDFQVDKSFFASFEDSYIQDGSIEISLQLERKTGHLELNFDFEGTVKTDCDRCSTSINLPIEGNEQIIAKYSEETQEDEDEIIFIHPETSELNVAQYIYEYINLAVPIRKVYDCENDENPPCDFETLAYLEQKDSLKDDDDDEDDDGSDTWDALKNLNVN